VVLGIIEVLEGRITGVEVSSGVSVSKELL